MWLMRYRMTGVPMICAQNACRAVNEGSLLLLYKILADSARPEILAALQLSLLALREQRPLLLFCKVCGAAALQLQTRLFQYRAACAGHACATQSLTFVTPIVDVCSLPTHMQAGKDRTGGSWGLFTLLHPATPCSFMPAQLPCAGVRS